MNLENFKGTKGEWFNGWNKGLTGPTTPNISPTVDDDRKYIPITINKETIAIVIQPENNSIKQMEANAKLISKAPELLESLKSAVNLLKNTTEFEVLDSWKEEVRKLQDVVLNTIS